MEKQPVFHNQTSATAFFAVKLRETLGFCWSCIFIRLFLAPVRCSIFIDLHNLVYIIFSSFYKLQKYAVFLLQNGLKCIIVIDIEGRAVSALSLGKSLFHKGAPGR